MGTILASAIKTRILKDLPEKQSGLYLDTDYLQWINEGQVQAVIHKPDVNVTNAAQVLVAGTKQSIGTTGIAFVKATRNMGTDGATPGNPVYPVDMEQFSRRNRTWHTATASATVQKYMYDPNDPKTYYVYPPQPSSSFGYLEIVKSVVPTDISAIGSAINIGDEYATVLYHYGSYKANIEMDIQKAMMHLNQFYSLLGRLDLVEWKTSRKVTKEAAQ